MGTSPATYFTCPRGSEGSCAAKDPPRGHLAAQLTLFLSFFYDHACDLW
jgi:hypothetical protein